MIMMSCHNEALWDHSHAQHAVHELIAHDRGLTRPGAHSWQGDRQIAGQITSYGWDEIGSKKWVAPNMAAYKYKMLYCYNIIIHSHARCWE